MIVIPLEKYSDDGFKQQANSPTASVPDNITYSRLYYDDFAGSNYVQGVFVPGENSTVEFDNTGIAFVLWKLFVSTDGVTYTERKSYGGTEGKEEPLAGGVIDPATYDDYDIMVKKTILSVEQFVPLTLQELIDQSGTAVTGTGGVDYLYCRGLLSQNNLVNGGKAFFGTCAIDENDANHYYSYGINSPEVTVADSYQYTAGAKISTGVYTLQFRSDIGAGLAQTFVAELLALPVSNTVLWETKRWAVYNKHTFSDVLDPGVTWVTILDNTLVGYVEVDMFSDLAISYYSTGKILIRTFGTDGTTPADDILSAGVTIEIKAFPNLFQ